MDVVIAYASRNLTKAKSHYPMHKLEFLALKWAVVEKFHEYLYGLTFDVYTDNNPLTDILMMAKLDADSHQWVASLVNYSVQDIQQVACKTFKDWHQAQQVDPTLSLIISRLQGGTLGQ